jgi:hypothetical protein
VSGWFVGRTEHLETIRMMLGLEHPGPLMIAGEPGIGRTSLLVQALGQMNGNRDVAIVVAAEKQWSPFARAGIQASVDVVTVPVTEAAILHAAWVVVEGPGERRPVFLVDDAHLAGHGVVHLLRELHRTMGAALVLTRPVGTSAQTPDPLDGLRYEADVRFLTLGPLDRDQIHTVLGRIVGGMVRDSTADALHQATGGNPGLLNDLMIDNQLAGGMVQLDGMWQVPAELSQHFALSERGRRRLVAAVIEAWISLSLDRVDELCKIAIHAGGVDEAACVWAFTMLVRGHAPDGLDFLDSLDLSVVGVERGRQLSVTRALLLAFGMGRVEEAETLLDQVGRASLPANQLLLAVRAWILATVGRTDQAAAALDDVIMDGNQDASVFAHAAAAAVELAHDRPKRAVSHLRRAIIGAGTMRSELPWLAPFLTGVLTDALLLAGRINEATIAAADFHASHGGSGWDVAVSLSSLIRSVSAAPDQAYEAAAPDESPASVDLPPPTQPGTGEPAMEVSF